VQFSGIFAALKTDTLLPLVHVVQSVLRRCGELRSKWTKILRTAASLYVAEESSSEFGLGFVL
jgi:hypothetical protein